MFELASRSAKKPRKARNGDQVLTRETEDGSALLVLADGIGGRPCDWKASDVACEILADTLEERSGTLGERLEAGVEAAHRRVQKETGRCEEMLAALVALACEPETEEVSFVGVSDARIYRLPAGRGAPQQLTSDDITAERVELDVEVQRAAFAPDAGLALASDGAYPLDGFGGEVRRVFEAGPMQTALDAWLGSDSLSNEDDATAALLRQTQVPPSGQAACKKVLRNNEDFRERGLAAHLMIDVAFGAIERGLAESASEAVDRGLAVLASGKMHPGRERMLDVVNRIADTDLRDRDERVPMQGGEDARDTIQRYFEEEIASYVPDAWIDWDDAARAERSGLSSFRARRARADDRSATRGLPRAPARAEGPEAGSPASSRVSLFRRGVLGRDRDAPSRWSGPQSVQRSEDHCRLLQIQKPTRHQRGRGGTEALPRAP
jgi:hypothetical protein